MKIKTKIEEMLLGVGLGLGYLTSLRFIGPIGISEILILLVIMLLYKRFYKKLFTFTFDFKGFVKGYMFLSLFVISPLVTLAFFCFSDLNSNPIYIISFMMGWLLCFLLVEALKNDFDMSVVTFYFSIIFVLTNIITIIFFPSSLDSSRYHGGADNPNQLLFYASSLSLLLVIYQKKIAFSLIPIITYIMFLSGSDAYLLTVFVTLYIYFYLLIFYYNRLSLKVNILLNTIFLTSIVIMILAKYSNEIILIWNSADEGGSRISLMYNALIVSFTSPLFGLGTGSFSGINFPFEKSEAHNTFLDLSMQFGLLFSLFIYLIFFLYFFYVIRSKQFLLAAFVLAFVVSGFFHFTGRHFNFWVELSIFYYYVFVHNKNYLVYKKGVMKCVE